ncbi:hypothetical protein [Bradyrhizobium sp. URHC0002]
MLIGTPSDDLGNLLGGRIGVSRDGTGDRDIGSGRFDNRKTKQLQEVMKAVDPALRPHAIHCHVVRSIGPSA